MQWVIQKRYIRNISKKLLQIKHFIFINLYKYINVISFYLNEFYIYFNYLFYKYIDKWF